MSIMTHMLCLDDCKTIQEVAMASYTTEKQMIIMSSRYVKKNNVQYNAATKKYRTIIILQSLVTRTIARWKIRGFAFTKSMIELYKNMICKNLQKSRALRKFLD